MSSFSNVKKKQSLSEIFTNIASGITGFYVFLILTVFPLYTHDMYFDILGVRYMFFKVWGISLSVILLLLGILYLIIDAQNKVTSPSALERLIESVKPKNITKNFIITDYFFIAMIVVMIISTLGTKYKEEAMFGTAGRYQGLECWIVYMITYFSITRTFKFNRLYLDFAILAGCFACIWGTMDFLWLDPFGFFKNVSDYQKGMFASSIGNLNTYTNYTIMVFAIAGSLFAIEKNLWRSIFYGVCALISCIGSVTGLADNIVLGFLAFYLFLPFFTFKTRRQFLRYLILIDLLFISIFVLWCMLKLPHNKWQSSFFQSLLQFEPIAFAFIPFSILILVLYFVFIKLKPNYDNVPLQNLNPLDSILPKQFILSYKIIVALGFVVVVYIFLDMNVFKKHVDIWKQLPSSNQLVFDDYWGTHRGHNWRIAFTNFFQNFNLFQKLFGFGPDTYLVVSERTFYKEMVERFGEVYDSAHNEYINYLICEGLLGLLSYLGIFISGVRQGIKNFKYNYLLLAPVMAVICYLVQAFVNIAIPITTPIFFTFMYIGVAEYFYQKKLNV